MLQRPKNLQPINVISGHFAEGAAAFRLPAKAGSPLPAKSSLSKAISPVSALGGKQTLAPAVTHVSFALILVVPGGDRATCKRTFVQAGPNGPNWWEADRLLSGESRRKRTLVHAEQAPDKPIEVAL